MLPYIAPELMEVNSKEFMCCLRLPTICVATLLSGCAGEKMSYRSKFPMDDYYDNILMYLLAAALIGGASYMIKRTIFDK